MAHFKQFNKTVANFVDEFVALRERSDTMPSNWNSLSLRFWTEVEKFKQFDK